MLISAQRSDDLVSGPYLYLEGLSCNLDFWISQSSSFYLVDLVILVATDADMERGSHLILL